MKLVLLSLLLTFPSHTLMAADGMTGVDLEDACEYMESFSKQNQDADSFVSILSSDRPNFEKLLPRIKALYETFKKDYNDPITRESALINCPGQLRRLANLGPQATIGHERSFFGGGNGTLKAIFPGIQEVLAKKEDPVFFGDNCKHIREDECNTSANPLDSDPEFIFMKKVLDKMIDQKTPAFSDKDCACLYARIEKGLITYNPMVLADQAKKFEEAVIKKAGAKFLNEYAANIEDVNYYIENKGDVFAKSLTADGKTEYESGLACNDGKKYSEAIEHQCKGRIDDKDVRKQRLNLILNSLGEIKGSSIKDKLNNLNEDILTLVVDPKEVPKGSPDTFHRKMYDKFRLGLIEKEPQVTFVDKLTTLVLSDRLLRRQVEDHVKSGKAPYEAVKNVLYTPGNRTALRGMISHVKGSNRQFYKDMPDLLDKDFEENMDGVFNQALSINPGLKNLLRDESLFDDVKSLLIADGNAESMLGLMESEKNALIKHFHSRCDAIVSNLAQIVCMSEDSKKDIPRKEMIGIANEIRGKDINLANEAFLICKYNDEGVKSDAFSSLSDTSKDPFALSDFQNRKVNKALADQTNGFARTMYHIGIKKDKNVESYVTEAVQTGEKNSVRAPINLTKDPIISFRGSGNELKFDKVPTTSSESTTSTLVKPDASSSMVDKMSQVTSGIINPTSTTQTAPQTPVVPLMMPRISTPAPATAVANSDLTPTSNHQVSNTAGNQSKIKQELNKVIEQDYKSSDLKKHVSNISDKDAQELIELRQARLRDQMEISELKAAEEKRKTEEAKAKYESLEKKYAELLKEKNTGRQPTSIQNDHDESVNEAPELPKFSDKVIMFNGQSTGGGEQMQLSDVQSSGGKAKIRDNAGGGANAVAFREGVEAKNEAQIIVQRTTDKPLPQDPDEQLAMYLTKEPDVRTLKQFVTTGKLILTYEDVRKDGSKVQTKKVVKYEELDEKTRNLIKSKLIEVELAEAKQAYSLQALKFEFLYADRLRQ